MMVLQHLNEGLHATGGPGLLSTLTWVDMQNYRDPPPYPGHSKQVYSNQPGFRQSYSGSETSTDVSLSSTENLATLQRQEPQGEETQTSFNYQLDITNSSSSSYSILERLGMPAATLDSSGKPVSIVNAPVAVFSRENPQQSQFHQPSAASTSNNSGLPSASLSSLHSQGHLTVPQWQIGNKSFHRQSNTLHQNEVMSKLGIHSSSSRSESELAIPSSSSVTNILGAGAREASGNYSSYSSPTDRPASSGCSTSSASGILSSLLPSSSCYHYLSPRVPPVSTYHHPHPYVNTHWIVGSEDASSSLLPSTSSSCATTYSVTYSSLSHSPRPSHSSTHGQTLSYLTSLPPPPQYPGVSRSVANASPVPEKGADIRSCRSYEAMDKMDNPRPRPDLRLCASSPGICMRDVGFQSPQRSTSNSTDDSDQPSIAARAIQMMEMMTEENRALREELALSSIKVAKLQKFELEIQRVHESHEALVKSSQKQEALWLAMRRKLEERIKELEAQKTGGGGVGGGNAEIRVTLAEKDSMISKLLSQNQELTCTRDRLERENSRLSFTLSEQRARVDILENALLNAQTKVLALEDEYHKKQVYAGKVEQLQKALTGLQAASEKQKEKEKELRARLEKELEIYKIQDKDGDMKMPELGREETKNAGTLKRLLDERDAKIMQLESEISGLEQKYVKETMLRQLKMEESSQVSKDVHLAALEKNSSSIERMIDEVKVEKLKNMEELHQSQKKIAELEAKVKQLQTQLTEKEAVVKVFQRSPLSMARSSSLHALCHSPLHSPHSLLLSSRGWPGNMQVPDSSNAGSYREFPTIRHVKAGSASAVELGRKMSMEDDLLTKFQKLNTESKSDSEDEGKLFHV